MLISNSNKITLAVMKHDNIGIIIQIGDTDNDNN